MRTRGQVEEQDCNKKSDIFPFYKRKTEFEYKYKILDNGVVFPVPKTVAGI